MSDKPGSDTTPTTRPPLVVNQELIDEVARRATARYFEWGINPSYLQCLGQPEVDSKPMGKMLNCIREAFAAYARDPRHVQDEPHPEIPQGPYCYTIVGRKGLAIQTETCPHWGIDRNREDQNNGYCKLTGLNDWEDGTLAWDQVKSCGINEEEPSE